MSYVLKNLQPLLLFDFLFNLHYSILRHKTIFDNLHQFCMYLKFILSLIFLIKVPSTVENVYFLTNNSLSKVFLILSLQSVITIISIKSPNAENHGRPASYRAG